MENDIIRTVRITQILIDSGWKFIDNGYDQITSAINGFQNEEITFQSQSEFATWLNEQMQKL